MPNREYIIGGLENFLYKVKAKKTCEINGIMLSADDVESIVAMLKVQEPVEPVVDKNTSSGECEDPWGRLFFCGACGKRINEKYDPDEDDKYCKHCGRAVKWE